MKKISTFILTLFFILLFSACGKDKATIEITNNIKNVKLESISFGDISVGGNLLPGESAKRVIEEDTYNNRYFPMKGILKFYMTAKENKVLLYTKESYQIDKDDHLRIILTNETEVYNPMNISAEKEYYNISELFLFE